MHLYFNTYFELLNELSVCIFPRLLPFNYVLFHFYWVNICLFPMRKAPLTPFSFIYNAGGAFTLSYSVSYHQGCAFLTFTYYFTSCFNSLLNLLISCTDVLIDVIKLCSFSNVDTISCVEAAFSSEMFATFSSCS